MRIFKHINGIYYVDAYLHGKRIKTSLKTRSKKIAEEIVRANFDSTAGVVVRKISVAEFFALYWSHCEKTHTQKTLRADRFRLDFILASLKDSGILTIDQISKKVVLKLRSELWAKGCSNATINRHVGVLRAALNWAVENGIIEESPLLSIKKLKEERGTHRRIFSPEEVDRLVAGSADPLYAIYLRMLHYTGARMDEMRLLECRLVNLDRGEITFEHTKSNEARIIPIDSQTIEMLRPLVIPGKRFVFGSNEPAWNINVAGKMFSMIAKKAGVKGSLHDFRSTFASDLINEGVGLKTVQSLLGDKTARLVMEVYAQVVPNASRLAIDDLRRARERSLKPV